MSRLLLDTNVAVHLLLGERGAVPADAEAALVDERNSISLSAVSVWEIAIKRSLGKLPIADGWLPALLRLDFEPLPITYEHAAAVERLPWHHRDPFDRLLIAQATLEQCVLVSADRQFVPYDVHVIW